ncbi:MAG: nucleotidyltransferase family protein [Thermoanaerobaculia bacterium]
MRAIVLAAGLGTRFRPATDGRPKALLPHLNVSLIDRRLARVRGAGISEIAVNLHHEGRQIVEHLDELGGDGAAPRFFWEAEILGTAGALRNAARFFGGDDFLIWNVDAELDAEIRVLEDVHRSSGAPATLLVVPNPDPSRFTALFADGDRLAAIGGPGAEPLLFTGVSIHSPRVLPRIGPGFRSLVDDLWRPLLEANETIRVVRHAGAFSDLGTPGDLLAASLREIELREEFEPREGFFDRQKKVLAADPAPPGLLERCVVGRARLDASARLDRCVVWDGADVGPGAAASRCVLGPVRLPAGREFRDSLLWPGPGGEVREIPFHGAHRRSPAVK